LAMTNDYGVNGHKLKDLQLKQTKILDIVDEADGIKTFHLDGHLGALPGQFVMLWHAEFGARPFSVYQDEDDRFALTIARIGDFTSQLFGASVGENLGYFGPYGKPFDIRGSHLALVGGGYGSAPLTFVAKAAAAKGVASELIIGAAVQTSLLYRERTETKGVTKHFCTDDGSFGFKGFTTDKLDQLLKSDPSIDMVYTVGPELMMKKVVEICDDHDVDCQISLERYIKCGFGLCGSCCVDPTGFRMCMEGPCIDKETAKGISEFGVFHRDSAGFKHMFQFR
jgi:dihydroorotate dehydrogenase electron transfer subunit